MFLVIHLYQLSDPDMNLVTFQDPIAIFSTEEKADEFIRKNANPDGTFVYHNLYFDETLPCGRLAKIQMPLDAPAIPESDFWWKNGGEIIDHYDFEGMMKDCK